MNGRVKKLSCGVVVVASLLGAGACSRPAENAPVRITGDNTKSNPAIEETSTTEAPEAPPTTRYWSPDGPGGSGADAGAGVDGAPNAGTGSSTTTTSTTTTTEAD